MYPVNDLFYANKAMMPRMLAEDTGVLELRNQFVYTGAKSKIKLFHKIGALLLKKQEKSRECQNTNAVCSQG